MPVRKPTDVVQVGLRLREGLRQQVIREAHKNRTSINQELSRRIEQSFLIGALRDLESIAAEMASSWPNYKTRAAG